MRTLISTIIAILFILSSYTLAFVQENTSDRLVVQFSDPSKPGFIKIGLINGGISVTGYEGKEVIVEAATRSKQVNTEEKQKKVNGMFRIPIVSTGLEVEEENNRMEIGVESWKRTIDIIVKVPKKTDLKLSCVNAGDISVENIEGEIEVNNINGKVTLSEVSGSVVAHALNKDLTVLMKNVYPEKAMSFSTLNGDVDVTFPSNIKADVKLKSDNGEIYSDFEIELKDNPKRIVEENGRGKGGKYRVEVEKWIYGAINGGGQEMSFKSFNGDIFIRKSN